MLIVAYEYIIQSKCIKKTETETNNMWPVNCEKRTDQDYTNVGQRKIWVPYRNPTMALYLFLCLSLQNTNKLSNFCSNYLLTNILLCPPVSGWTCGRFFNTTFQLSNSYCVAPCKKDSCNWLAEWWCVNLEWTRPWAAWSCFYSSVCSPDYTVEQQWEQTCHHWWGINLF